MNQRNRIFAAVLVLSLFTLELQGQSREVPVYDFEAFEPLLQPENDTLYVLNFWATWCRPCVAELPYFEKINAEYADQKVKVILVSLDFSENLETMVIPFLDKRNIKSQVILLEESDPNSWIDKVSTDWSGAIPATIFIRNNKSKFHEGDYSYDALKAEIDSFIN